MAELEQLNSRIEVETVGIDVTSARLKYNFTFIQLSFKQSYFIRKYSQKLKRKGNFIQKYSNNR